MEINDRPFVPPTCPLAVEPTGTFIDPEGFAINIHGCPGLVLPPAPAGTFVYTPDDFYTVRGTFYPVAPEPRVQAQVVTGTARAELYSELEAKLNTVRQPGQRATRVAEVARRLCDRVRVCHGVEPDGQCWALGERALRETIEDLD